MDSPIPEVEMATNDARRKSDIATIASLLTIVVTVSGFVWNMAKLDSTVEQLQNVMHSIEASEIRRQDEDRQTQQRLQIVETRQGEIARRIDRLEDYHR